MYKFSIFSKLKFNVILRVEQNFNIGNAFKYLWRAGLKDESKTIQDLEKAIFYIKDEINRLEGKYVN